MPRRHSHVLALITVAVALLAVPAARAETSPFDVAVGFPAVTTQLNWDDAAAQAAVVGDVDGNGLDDVAVGVAGAQTVWVSYTPATRPSSTTAGQPGWHGFTITNVSAGAIVGLPDVNGDGLGEVAILDGTTVDVIFGRPDGTVIDASALGTDGFRIINAEDSQAGSRQEWGERRMGAHQLAAVGDQNGDGAAELVVATSYGAALVSGATAPGTTIDASDGSQTLVRLLAASSQDPFSDAVSVGSLGDVDGDGRQDIMLAWEGRDIMAAGVEGLTPSTTAVDVRDWAAAGHGFVYDGDYGLTLEDATTIGDQNGDGRRDILLVSGSHQRGYDGMYAWLVPSPAPGSHAFVASRAVAELEDGVRVDPIGDLDQDGVEDFADDDELFLSTWMRQATPTTATLADVDIVGSARDIGEDGAPDAVALWADPFEVPTYVTGTATYHVETMADLDYSAPEDGTDITPTAPGPSTPAPSVALPLSAVPLPSRTPVIPRNPVVSKPLVKPHGITRHGTKRNDTLVGSAFADVLKGLAGNDTILGLAGADAIDGGPGRDHVDAGPGNDRIQARDGAVDVIACGSGDDTVIADRDDRVSRCEHVRRPKARTKR